MLFSSISLEKFNISTLLKLILFSESTPLSGTLQAFSYICSQIQTLSVLINTALLSMPTQTNWFQKALKTIHQIFSGADLFGFAEYQEITFLILAVTLTITILTVASLAYFAISLKKNCIHSRFTQILWSSFLCLYTHCLCYPIHYFGLKAYKIFQRSNQGWVSELKIAPGVYMGLTLLVLALNFILSIGYLYLFKVRAKTQNLLCSSNSTSLIVDFFLKMSIPIFWIYIEPSDGLYVPLLSVNLFLCLVKDLAFFLYLPFYRIQMLRFAVKVQTFLTAFALSAFLSKTITSHYIHNSLDFSALLCLVTIPLYIYFSNKFLWQKLVSIVTLPLASHKLSDLLHYWDVYKYLFLNSNLPRSQARKIRENFLFYKMAENQFQTNQTSINNDEVFSHDENELVDINQVLKIFQYLVKSSDPKNPDRWLIKAYLAKFYLKNESSYILADSLLNKILRNHRSLTQTASVYYLKLQLINKLSEKGLEEGEVESKKLNIQSFIKLSNLITTLRTQIIHQLKPQIKFWNILSNSQVDVATLTSQAIRARTSSKNIEKFWRINYPQFVESSYAHPLMIYGFYLSFAQNDTIAGDKLLQEYFHQELKLRRKIQETPDSFITQLLASESLHFIISGSPETIGRILDCSSNIHKFLGYKKDLAVGRSANILMPAFFAERHDRMMQEPHEIVRTKAFGKAREVCLKDKRGFLQPVLVYLTQKFMPQHGLCYYIVAKPPSVQGTERILVSKEGHLLNFSEGFAKDLNLNPKTHTSMKINSLCPEFQDIIQAYLKWLGRDETFQFQNHSIRLKTTETDTQENLSSYGTLVQKFTQGTNLSFSPIPHESQKASRIFVHTSTSFVKYKTTIQTFSFHKDIVFKVSLTRVGMQNNQETRNDICLTSIQSPQRVKRADIPSILRTDADNLGGTTQRFVHYPTNEPLPSSCRGLLTKNYIFDADSPTFENQTSAALIKSNCVSTLAVIENSQNKLRTHYGDHNTPNLEDEDEDDDEQPAVVKVINSHSDSDSYSKTNQQQQKDDHKNLLIEFDDKQIIDHNYIESRILKLESDGETQFMTKRATNQRIKKSIKNRALRPSTILFAGVFLLTMALQLVFLLWMSFAASQIIKNATSTSDVIEALHFRIAWVNLANQEIRFLDGIRGGWLPSDWTFPDGLDTIHMSIINLQGYNKNLLEAVSSLEPSYQSKFYEKNIAVYDRYVNNQSLYTISIDNSFLLTDRLISKAYELLKITMPDEPLEDFIDPTSRFIFDNSFNDLFTVSDDLITLMEQKLTDDFSASETQQAAYLSVIIVFLCLFGVASFLFISQRNKIINFFFIKLLTVKADEINKSSLLLSIYSRMLQEDQQEKRLLENPILTYFSFRDIQISEPPLESNNKIQRKLIEPRSLNQLYYVNYHYLFGIILILGALIAVVCAYYSISVHNISTIKQQQNAVNVALSNMKKHSFISCQLAALIMENDTTTVQGVPVLESVTQELDDLNSIVELYDTFIKDQKNVPEDIYNLLYNRSCNDAYMPDYTIPEDIAIAACMHTSQYSGSIGLLQIDSVLNNNLNQYLDEFLASNRTRDSLKALFYKIPSDFIDSVDTSVAYSLFLVDAVQSESENLRNKFSRQRTALTMSAFLVSLFFTALAWKFIIRKIINKELVRKDFFNLLPTKTIRENQLLIKAVLE